MTVVDDIVVKQLGRVDYAQTWEAMRAFTKARDEATPDELWLLEHPPLYTLGQGAAIPVVPNGIQIVKTDRGGDITYHGPGQIVAYTLFDLARRGIKVDKRKVHLDEPIRNVGTHMVVVEVTDGVTATVKTMVDAQ